MNHLEPRSVDKELEATLDALSHHYEKAVAALAKGEGIREDQARDCIHQVVVENLENWRANSVGKPIEFVGAYLVTSGQHVYRRKLVRDAKLLEFRGSITCEEGNGFAIAAPPDLDPALIATNRNSYEHLLKKILDLSPKTAAALIYHAFGMSYQEIAVRLRTSPAYARGLKSTAIRLLRESLRCTA
jgi:DNA-directed RNA polymerase specialized sigma24 family protein